jgi:hypothetical protein
MQRRYASPAFSQLGRHSRNEEQVENNRAYGLCAGLATAFRFGGSREASTRHSICKTMP